MRLSDDVYFCVTEGQGIFLDLRRDTYSAVRIDAGGASAGATADDVIAAQLAPHAELLVDEGLVSTDGAGNDRLADFRGIARPESHIAGADGHRAFGLNRAAAEGLRISVSDIIAVLASSWRASRLLRTRHIHEIVSSVRARKERNSGKPQRLEDIQRQTLVFGRIRPWFPRGYLCLLDALALNEFLARRGLYPDWIFGVQVQPFGAHCWVQAQGHLLNEEMEYASQFTPIMVA